MLDRMRETLFNILQLEVEGCVFADLYAGTGAVGIEALSRGAKQSIFVEANPKALRVVERNLETLGAKGDGRIILGSASEKVPLLDADIWFVGPPYDARSEYEKTLAALGEKGAELVIVQHRKVYDPPEQPGVLELSRKVKMGSNVLSFYRRPEAPDESPSETEPLA